MLDKLAQSGVNMSPQQSNTNQQGSCKSMGHNDKRPTPPIIARPVITDPDEVDDNTPDSRMVSVDVAAALTGFSVGSLRTMRNRRSGPPSFVLRHKLVYRLGDLRDYLTETYTSTLVTEA